MTEAFALDYIPRRMNELGHGNDYYIRFEHFVLQPNEELEIKAYNELYLLIHPVDKIRVESEFGLFDLSFDRINKLQYEHEGLIIVNNYSGLINHITFIKVVPKNKNVKH